jgi:hypothetical protein
MVILQSKTWEFYIKEKHDYNRTVKVTKWC